MTPFGSLAMLYQNFNVSTNYCNLAPGLILLSNNEEDPQIILVTIITISVSSNNVLHHIVISQYNRIISEWMYAIPKKQNFSLNEHVLNKRFSVYCNKKV